VSGELGAVYKGIGRFNRGKEVDEERVHVDFEGSVEEGLIKEETCEYETGIGQRGSSFRSVADHGFSLTS